MKVRQDPGSFGLPFARGVTAGMLGLDGESDRARDQRDGGDQLGDDAPLPRLGAFSVR